MGGHDAYWRGPVSLIRPKRAISRVDSRRRWLLEKQASQNDFKIDGTPAPVPPADCASPMLLIRNAAGAAWFAVGIFRPNND
jgi:hypothetical protein